MFRFIFPGRDIVITDDMFARTVDGETRVKNLWEKRLWVRRSFINRDSGFTLPATLKIPLYFPYIFLQVGRLQLFSQGHPPD